ncbi:MAG: DUF4350 domain-containing protein [Chitinophagaceae bacterium]|nr:DUF4350 domain-containing protein [Chitinophagaceae bacterium]
MSPVFSMNSKKPFGTYASEKMFSWEFNTHWVYKNKKNFAEASKSIEGKRNLYFIIANELILSDEDVNAMLNYLSEGNQLFIAANDIDYKLLDTLSVKVDDGSSLPSLFGNADDANLMRRTNLYFADTARNSNRQYGFFYYPFTENFSNFDSSQINILGLGDKKKPDFISFTHGNGRIFLHLHPAAFSNYFLIKEDNHEYVQNVLSYLNADRKTIYWDDYYRMGIYPSESFSSLGVFFKYPPLKWALLIIIFTALAYIITSLNRRQRVIPVIPPNTNSSLSFVDTIGRLYLQHKDHHNIVHKMVTYFMEKIRTRYYLNTAHVNSEFISSLSRKSGVQETEVKSLFQYINQLQEAPEISDEQLLELNNRMLPFFKT